MATVYALALYGFLGIGVFLLADALYRFVRGAEDVAVERRLVNQSADKDTATERRIIRRQENSSRLTRGIPFIGALQRLIQQAGMTVTTDTVIGIMFGIAVVVAAIMILTLPGVLLPLIIILAPVEGIGAVLWYLRRAATARRKKFEEQLPDAIDLIIRSLKIGHPLSSSISVVARELPDPVSTEFQTRSRKSATDRTFLPHSPRWPSACACLIFATSLWRSKFSRRPAATSSNPCPNFPPSYVSDSACSAKSRR